MILDPHPDPDQHKKLITSRGSPLAHTDHVWLMSNYAFVSYPAHRQTDRQTDRQTERPTDRPTDRQTDRQTDRPTQKSHNSTSVGEVKKIIMQQHKLNRARYKENTQRTT